MPEFRIEPAVTEEQQRTGPDAAENLRRVIRAGDAFRAGWYAALAQGQVRRAAIRWVVCAAAFVAWVVVPVIEDEFLRTEIGFTGTAGLLVALLWLIYRRPHERAEDVPDPGSTEELEAQLAAADEGT